MVMKKVRIMKIYKKMLGCLLVLLIGFVITVVWERPAFAALTANQLISSVKSLSPHNYCGSYCKSKNNCSSDANYGHQYFSVAFNWKDRCASPYTCKVLSWSNTKPSGYTTYKAPWCSTGYGNCATKDQVESVSISHIGTDKDMGTYWRKYYLFTLKTPKTVAGDSGHYQNVKGIIERHVPEVTLKAVAKDDKGNVLKNPMSTSTVQRLADATVTRSGYNPSGYEFVKWEDSTGCGTNTGCTVKDLTDDKTIIAIFKKKETKTCPLIAVAKDINGGGVLLDPMDTDTVAAGGSATSTRADISRYDFVKWDDSTGCGTSATCKQTVPDCGKTIVAWYREKPKYTLTADAWDCDNNEKLQSSFDSETVYTGEQAAVSSDAYDPDGYEWNKWEDGTGCGDSPNCTQTMTANKTIKACYKKNTFEGQSIATGLNGTVKVGFAHTSKSDTLFLENCTSGCFVAFMHKMKRTVGSGSTEYSIERISNSDKGQAPRKVSSGLVKSTTVFSESVTGKEVTVRDPVGDDTDVILYPGMIVCEVLSFKPYNTVGAKNVTMKVCAAAKGRAQPDDPSNPDAPESGGSTNSYDKSLVNIKVKNNNVSKYSNYERSIYAKPGDGIVYRGSYNPVLQYTYNLVPEVIKIDGGKNINGSSGKTLGDLFNSNRGSLAKWNNAFSIRDDVSNQYIKDSNSGKYAFIYTLGSWELRTATQAVRTVSSSDVGKNLKETAIINGHNDGKTTPTQVTFTDSDGKLVGDIDTTSKERAANVYVPYNYRTSTSITKNGSEVVYAGEDYEVNGVLNVLPKANSLTTNGEPGEEYATNVSGAKWKVVLGLKDSEGHLIGNYSTEYTNVGNDGTIEVATDKEQKEGKKDVKLAGIRITIPDVPAGSKVCLKSVVFPASSGSDSNLGPNGEGESVSEEQCFDVAKRPSLQVWGGNVFSRGRIQTSVSKKKHLGINGVSGYSITSNNEPTIFGSFGELGVVTASSVKLFASGASSGYALNSSGVLSPNEHPDNGAGNNPSEVVGGTKVSSFCNRSLLTLPNNCSNDGISNNNIFSASSGMGYDKETILSRFSGYPATSIEGGNIGLSDKESGLYHSNEDLSIAGSSVGGGKMLFVYSDKNVRIDGNIGYTDSYTSLDAMPKVVIYAKKNITIACDVNSIDGLLIAEGVVKTCADSDDEDVNDSRRSNQLKVNGAILAGSLKADRTYGAASGANSIIPAEIINFDPSLYSWKGLQKEDESGKSQDRDMDVTYLIEVAPRL